MPPKKSNDPAIIAVNDSTLIKLLKINFYKKEHKFPSKDAGIRFIAGNEEIV